MVSWVVVTWGPLSWEKTGTNDSITFLYYAVGGNKKAAFHSKANHLLANRPGVGMGFSK